MATFSKKFCITDFLVLQELLLLQQWRHSDTLKLQVLCGGRQEAREKGKAQKYMSLTAWRFENLHTDFKEWPG